MTIAMRVKRHLEVAGVPYEVVPHRETFTAQGTAVATHVSGWQVAKVLVGRDETGYVMAVLPASCHLDLPAFRSVSGRKHLVLATEGELMELFPDCEVGAMPPLGKLYGMPVYADSCFVAGEDLLFPAGSHREVVQVAWKDFLRAAQPVVTDFCRR